jgi:hypothetical protein
MDMRVGETGETAITVVFHKPLSQWSADDRKVIVRRLRQFFKRSCKGKRKPAAVRRPRDAQRDR